MGPQVSVIYVNYNSSELLIQSIKSLKTHCSEVPFEIIVVDNASADEEKLQLQTAANYFEGGLNIIFSETNLGFSRANNLGAAQASGDFLFFLNPDTLVLNNVLKIFCEFLNHSDQNVAACGGNLLEQDLSPNYSYGNFPGMLYEICSVGFGLSLLFKRYYDEKVFIGKKVQGIDPIEAPYITGADLFIRSQIFREIVGFDEQFFMYYEETDLFMRLKMRGFKSYVIPEARIIHYEGGSVGKTSAKNFNYKKLEMTMQSKVYYFNKWFPAYKVRLLKAVILLQLIFQYLKGKQGNSLIKLFTLYNNVLTANTKAKRLQESSS